MLTTRQAPRGAKQSKDFGGLTIARMTYFQQIRDPQWIRLATQIKEEHGWTCEHCQRPQGEVELTVHHSVYLAGKMMWEHPRCLLLCLCTECHTERQDLEQQIFVNVADVMRDKTNAELREQPIYAFFTAGFTLNGREAYSPNV